LIEDLNGEQSQKSTLAEKQIFYLGFGVVFLGCIVVLLFAKQGRVCNGCSDSESHRLVRQTELSKYRDGLDGYTYNMPVQTTWEPIKTSESSRFGREESTMSWDEGLDEEFSVHSSKDHVSESDLQSHTWAQTFDEILARMDGDLLGDTEVDQHSETEVTVWQAAQPPSKNTAMRPSSGSTTPKITRQSLAATNHQRRGLENKVLAAKQSNLIESVDFTHADAALPKTPIRRTNHTQPFPETLTDTLLQRTNEFQSARRPGLRSVAQVEQCPRLQTPRIPSCSTELESGKT
jgi:hypothetical protein